MKIKYFGQFLKENIESKSEDAEIFNILMQTPTEDILELRDSLEVISMKKESLNENFITSFIDKLKNKFRRTIDNRIWKYLIDRKQDFYLDLAEKMNIFDISDLGDVYKNYPGFKLESIYLAGGMDKALDVGAGWRFVVENEFESYPGRPTGLPEISMKEFGTVEPKRVVNDIYLDKFIENPTKTKKLYNLPLILNPVRKEVDRTKDMDFLTATQAYKKLSHKSKPEDFEPTMTSIRKTMSRTIEPGDEHLVRIADLIFLGLNDAAAAGTYGELQTQSFMNKPIFVYMTSPKWTLGPSDSNIYAGFSPWSFPHYTKLARNEDEMKILVKAIMKNVK